MSKAFILIICESGSDDYIITKLRAIDRITYAYSVFGLYDIIAQMRSISQENLESIITKKIRKLGKILKTITLLAEEKTEVLDEIFTKKQENLKGIDVVNAFIMVNCKNMDEYNTLRDLSKIPEIIDGDIILGHDVIMCKVSAPTYNDIEDVVTKKIRKLQGINSTMTLNVIPHKENN
jgi:DNA-binding Lrp family transcriptional regulator